MKTNVKEALKNIGYFFLSCTIIYCFYCIMSITEYKRDQNFIKNKENFKKIKIKIDSVRIRHLPGGRDRHSTDEDHEFFNKKNRIFVLRKDYDKPIFTPNRKFEVDEVNKYRKEHHDSILVWYLDENFIQYARENEKEINLSEKTNDLNKKNIEYAICMSLVLIILSVFLYKKNKSK
jgi:hypothetical protein